MESPINNFKKPATAPALQVGDVVVPGRGTRPNVTSGDNDHATGNIAEPAGSQDGKGNSASQPTRDAAATPKSEPAPK